MRFTKWFALAGLAGAAAVLPSCKLVTGHLLSFDEAVVLQFLVPNGVRQDVFFLDAPYDYQLHPGNTDVFVKYKLVGSPHWKTKAAVAQLTSLDLEWDHYNAAGTQVIDTIKQTVPMKHGKGKLHLNPIGGFNVQARESISLSVTPHGADLPVGATVSLKYQYFGF
jgi:hypothetical protein